MSKVQISLKIFFSYSFLIILQFSLTNCGLNKSSHRSHNSGSSDQGSENNATSDNATNGPAGNNDDGPIQPNGDEQLSQAMLDGIKLWNDNCLSCHQTHLTTDKKGATKSAIKTAIETIPKMQHLTHLTDMDLELIAGVLVLDKLELKAVKVHLGNRYFIYNKFTQLFNSNKTPDIQAIIDDISILQQPNMLGGACSPNSAICSWSGEGRFGISHVKSKDAIRGGYALAAHVSHTGFPNVVRRGVIIKTCAKLTSNNQALQNLLSFSSLNINSELNTENIKKLIYSFTPGRVSSQEAVNKLKGLGDAAKSKGLNGQDSWRVISYAICGSDWNEVI